MSVSVSHEQAAMLSCERLRCAVWCLWWSLEEVLPVRGGGSRQSLVIGRGSENANGSTRDVLVTPSDAMEMSSGLPFPGVK